MSIKHWLKNQLDYGLLLAFVLPIFAFMPLLTHAGLPNTADGPAHLMRQVELNQAWQEGNFYPRWGTDLALGHGMPIFSYAPPALYQLTQFFHLFGLPLDEAMKAVLVFDFLLYSLGMFLLARRLFGPRPALLAAALYIYAPYRLREAYIQGNYGQFTGLAFYPFILWAFHGLITTGRRRYLLAAAFSLAGLLLSHNISFMLFAPLLAAYLLFLLVLATRQPGSDAMHAHITHHVSDPQVPYGRFMLRTGQVAIASLLGLGLAAIFWLPAFGERHDIKLEGITQGFFDFRENFISLSELLAPPVPLDLAAINPEFPLSLGLPQLIGAGAGIIILLWVLGPSSHSHTSHLPPSHPPISQALFFACFLGLYTFLALPQSQPIWEAVPLLELAEFPWRMLGPAIFCASLLAGYHLSIVGKFLATKNFFSRYPTLLANLYVLFSIFLAIALNAYYLYPSQFIPWGTPTPADAFAYEVTSGAIGTTSTGEFLPRWAQQHPEAETLWPDYAAGRLPQKVDPATLPAKAMTTPLAHSAEADAMLIDTPEAFVATLRTLYWPGWQVYLNDQPVTFTVTPQTGLIQTVIPPGQHTLTLRLESTPLRRAGQWFTFLSFAILTLIAGWTLKARLSKAIKLFQCSGTGVRPVGEIISLQDRPIPEQPTIPANFFALTTGLFMIAYLLSRPLAPLFTLQSNPDSPRPAAQILSVDFGPSQATTSTLEAGNSPAAPLIRLVGLDNLPEAIESSAGTPLNVTLYWRALQELTTNYSVFLHLDTPDSQTWATVDEVHPENIPTRNWPPGLYLRNPLHLTLPAELPPIRYDVTVGVYDRTSGERLIIWPDGGTLFKVGSIWLTAPPPQLPAKPLAHFGPAITLWQIIYTAAEEDSLVLYWQTEQPLTQDYSIFIHLLDAQGNLLSQADGAPYAGLYPLSNWQPGQIIMDRRSLALLPAKRAALATIAIGIYDPATGERLAATDAAGNALSEASYTLPVSP